MIVPIDKYKCNKEGCRHSATCAGPSQLLVFIGWGFDDKKLYCPYHHPLGEEVVGNQINGAIAFARIAQKANDDPAMVRKINNLVGIFD